MDGPHGKLPNDPDLESIPTGDQTLRLAPKLFLENKNRSMFMEMSPCYRDLSLSETNDLSDANINLGVSGV